MHCSGCGYVNRDEARFCGGCGQALAGARVCASCGRSNTPDQRFCDACGASLGGEARTGAAPKADARAATDGVRTPAADPRAYTPRHLAEKILTVRSALEGERKHVTVLFADVASYTSLTETLDPEQIHALMDRCFQLILEQVHRYEGTVNQFTGDGVMALFGAPLALEDAPRRAVSAALAMQEALGEIDAEVRARHGREFRMRMGIHSGTVVVGKIGDDLRMDYTAVGDTTNLANRLQQLAPAGAVVISEATQRLVAGYFNIREIGEVAVKGRAAPVRAFEVTGERPMTGRIEAIAETGLTPLVGRRRELAQLAAAFDSADAGRGQIVFLVGDAGIGKSRLLHEFQQSLAARPHAWLEGRCASYARTTAFHSIADALRRGFGVTDRDDESAALAKLERAQSRVGGGLEWTLPFLRALLSLPVGDERVTAMDPVTRRSETSRAVQSLFLREAERQPLVLVIEDLHWIDSASEEFLAFLAESVPASRSLVLLTYRPGYLHKLGDRSYHVRMGLQPLSEQETEHMASALLACEGVPRELRDVIVAKAEGNPFFIEEVTKSLLEEGALRRTNGSIELARDLSMISIPDSIQDVIMARIDRLADAPKQAIQMASIIGREFALRLLDKIVAAGERVSELVGELRTLELVYEKAVHPELAYMFKHALTHDVAYESVLLQRRKTLHGLVGDAIEELYADRIAEHYESLAHHYTLAERWDKALDYHELAANKAADAYANHAAADHYRHAVDITRRLGDAKSDKQGELLRSLSNVLFCLNEFRAAGEANSAAAGLASDPESRSMALSQAAWCFHWGHDYERAGAAIRDALATAQSHGLAMCELLATLFKGFAEVTTGDLSNTEAWLSALRGLEPTNEREAAVKVVGDFFSAELAEWKSDYRTALATLERLLDSGSFQGDVLMIAHSEWFAGKAATCLGRYAHALTRMNHGVERSARSGDRAMQSRLLNTVGWCYSEFGCDRIAADYNRRAAQIGRELVELELVAGAPELYCNAAVNLAHNHISAGELSGADDWIASVEAELASSSDPWMRWRYGLHALHVRARYLMARGDAEKALGLVAREIDGARSYGLAKIEARALELRGRTLLVLERREEAEAALLQAVAIARKIEYPPTVWRSLALLGELARRADDREQARRHGAAAAALIESLSANLPDDRLRAEFRALGERAIRDPLSALR